MRALVAAAAALLLVAPAIAEPGEMSGAAVVSGGLALVAGGVPARVLADPHDAPAVRRAADDLAADLARVAGRATDNTRTVIVGTLGHNPVIDRLVAAHRLDVSAVKGGWEAFVAQVVERPAPGIARALVIAGSDRRGAIFGAYDLSARIGVSPWTWWADVPVRRRANLWVAPGARADHPRVKYRGLFLNDEDPALKGWVDTTFGGFNHKFYGRMFELILRLKGNLLWPAMWGKAFYDDDPANQAEAERYGIIIGTLHHEPLMRAHVEWARYGKGPWDYAKNAPVLRDFWRQGMVRAKGADTIVTVGMRGDGDEPMTQGTAIPLLERIVADQRRIIAEVTGKPAAGTPQVWALYKEVQDYYDQGMRVPDDVTLLFSDDNWGNLRRLPKPGDRRPGGYGIYYHFDYVGGPRNYKWINSSQIERAGEQLGLARANGADRLWIANVGDLKPLELPASFFLDYAWNPEAWPLARISDWRRGWAAQQFGEAEAGAIADVLERTARFAARRKFELLAPETWSLTRDDEARRVLADYDRLEADAQAIGAHLPANAQDAYYELVLHDVAAAANLNRLYVTVALNRAHAAERRADTNALADRAEALFATDKAIAKAYEARAGGKWPHMIAQTHIGYTSWQQPDADVMPAVQRIVVPPAAALGVGAAGVPAPLTIERFGTADPAIEIYNRAATPFAARVTSNAPWLRPERTEVAVAAATERVRLAVDWGTAPAGTSHVQVSVAGGGGATVPVTVVNHPEPPVGAGYVEADGHVAIEAAHFARARPGAGAAWTTVPGLGRTVSAVTPLPQNAPSQAPGQGPSLDYDLFVHAGGDWALSLVASPSLDTTGGRGLRYAIAIDGEAPQVVDLLAGDTPAAWDKAVIDAARVATTRHRLAAPGHHVVHLWMIDPGLSVQRLVLGRAPLDPAALGPAESVRF